jgi:hypothetical protein
LSDLIVNVLRQAGRPLTASQVVAETKRQGRRRTWAHFPKAVERRMSVLRQRGILKRVPNQPGYVLAQQPAPQSAAAKPAARATRPIGAAPRSQPSVMAGKQATMPIPGKSTAGAKPARRTPLRKLLTQILSRSDMPLTGSELAARAKQAGYRSSSKNFADVVWVEVRKIKSVEHVPNQGYRLKKATAKPAPSRS